MSESKVQFICAELQCTDVKNQQTMNIDQTISMLGGYSSASHRRGPGSCLVQSKWDLWLTKWHWDRVFSEFFGFTLSVSFHRSSRDSYITWGMLVAAVQRHNLTPSTRRKIYWRFLYDVPAILYSYTEQLYGGTDEKQHQQSKMTWNKHVQCFSN
jgi:hypothetical protein